MKVPASKLIAAACSIAALSILACDREAARTTRSDRQTLPAMSPASGARDAGFAGKAVEGGVASAPIATSLSRRELPANQASPTALPNVAADPSMIIRNGDVSVQVDSLELAIEAVRRLAGSVGGFLGDVAIHTGENEVRSATLQIKVPAPRFDEVMSGMKPLGKVEHSAVMSEDVGEEYVDISARIANAKRLEARLVTLLATRTGKLEDVLAVERELARVREEIERMEGRVRYLKTRVATSTISATVHERPPIVATQPGTNPITHAFVNMWRNFVGFVAASIEMLGVVIPVAALVWVGFLGWRRWRKPRGLAAA